MTLAEVRALEAKIDIEFPPPRRGDALILFDNLEQRDNAWYAFLKVVFPICSPFGIIASWLEMTEYREVTEIKERGVKC